jgi:hypothetical protein
MQMSVMMHGAVCDEQSIACMEQCAWNSMQSSVPHGAVCIEQQCAWNSVHGAVSMEQCAWSSLHDVLTVWSSVCME